jgi:steroid 5-alpha reductase family enzyme
MDALLINVYVCAALCFVVWLASVLTGDHSMVDRIWSIIPIVYAWIFAAGANFADLRLDVMAGLVSLWGARLTFNFARKGGYAKGGEDYRWPVLRASMKGWQCAIFNIFFIVIFQNAILLAITTPAYVVLENPGAFSLADASLTFAFLFFLALETVADQQQWNFHQHKKAELAAGRTVKPGFLSEGLFSISRHPNFFSEQAQWWVFAGFAIAASGAVDWTILGAVVLTGLFLGSTRFTEQITISKYPEYREYQKRVSALVPWWPRRG